ncbi:hypothetical protein PMI14_03740 [Acidovorax sp. CF316]|uniref:hypothetical protein n=1 Tax=Acidovorax sp. CF316 TaxID=1144317 RepID=UPI00026BE235|nr:hypothetical protein [Acidovorax sp. CF316]EJE51550.1 hypothetical protein PMI14_03740 [Acidovorax sp. CF316]
MNAARTAILRRPCQGAVAVRGSSLFHAHSASMPSLAKRLASQQRMASSAYLQGNGNQPQWLGNGFEDTAPPPGGGCNARQ